MKFPIIFKHWKVLNMVKTVRQNASVAELPLSGSYFLIYLDVEFHRVQEADWL